ncbi:hypothetical protein ACFWMR_30040 [Amycolatopsis thailandensis]|uniref:Uncharacterized protein n=1 Tax=Amycolatopsis thailandensis TaxID=589330 RepID=A0A229SC43_9PSEU|nr:hypothetical protein [Amycolatopsis thailandensis]OXM56341.1 hypothetical protein CFP71_13660 [Amycolatopsis thailandensis]
MPDNELPGFLIIGLIFVVADGQILYRGARRYLNGPDGREGGGSVAWMMVTVFHLAAIGVLALLAVVAPDWSGSTAAFVGRLGVFLLLMAVAHVLTLAVLARRRQDHVVESRYREREPDRPDVAEQPTVTPVPGQEGRAPRVSPDIGHQGPYRA